MTDLLEPAADPRRMQAPAAQPASRPRGRLLRNWRVRSRLVLLIAIPTATAVALGGSSIVSSWRSAVSYQRVAQLATLSSKVTALAFQLERERDNTVWFVALRTNYQTGNLDKTLNAAAKQKLQVVQKQYTFTDRAVKPVLAGVSAIGTDFPPGVVQDARSAKSEIGFLQSARQAAVSAQASAIDVIVRYSRVIDVLLAFEDQIALTSNDPQLTSTVSALSQMSRLEDEYSTQRGIIVFALTAGSFEPNMFGLLTESVANQKSDVGQFLNFATVRQNEMYKVALATGSLYDRFVSSESSVIQYAQATQVPQSAWQPGLLNNIGINPDEWFGNVQETIGNIRGVERALNNQAVHRAQDLRKKAIIEAVAIGSAVLLVLIISLLFTVVVGRSMVRPLRRLRAGALEVAGVRLPEMVRRMSEADSENVPIEVEPIDVASYDEIGEVARAFDQVHREALRLAANEAALRGNVNAMFVNLSRRSQSLVERQIRLIDELEQGEQDPERLGSLFQMDHLATRMRRNSENLLVLAGQDSTRRWNQPVPLVDVLRAAISEIEQYERVTLNVQPGIAVRGPAVNDVVHLIAELVENATSYSSADTPVSVSGHLLSSGGVLLDITDIGVGMGSDEMAHANWRLDNPPVVDVAVSRRMGLFVVARLAARHGIRVRLRPASGAGLTALVWLPDEVVVREGAMRPGSVGRFPEPLTRFAIGSGPAGTAGAGGTGGPLPVGAAGQPGPVGPVGSGEWPAVGTPTTEEEVAAARMPRFAPPEEAAANALGPQRVPGVGPHPGRFGPESTGPLAAVGAEPASSEPDAESDSPAALETDAGEPAASGTDSAAAGPSEPEFPAVPAQAALNEWSVPSAPSVSSASGTTGEHPVQPASPWGSQPAWPGEQVTQPAAAWPGDQTVSSGDDGQVEPVLGAPVNGPRITGSPFRNRDSGQGASNGGLIIPPAASISEENRLPIFEAVESDWFRRGRPSVEVSSSTSESPAVATWTSPGDEVWKVAEAAVAPTSAGTTMAGLPRRVPKANLIPGTAAETVTPSAPARSAAATRERFASLQRGMREGRAASGADKTSGPGDVPGDG